MQLKFQNFETLTNTVNYETFKPHNSPKTRHFQTTANVGKEKSDIRAGNNDGSR
jgi:hypothetical protein